MRSYEGGTVQRQESDSYKRGFATAGFIAAVLAVIVYVAPSLKAPDPLVLSVAPVRVVVPPEGGARIIATNGGWGEIKGQDGKYVIGTTYGSIIVKGDFGERILQTGEVLDIRQKQ